MLVCNECGSKIELNDLAKNNIVECKECGIELELIDNCLQNLQLGPSEE